MTWLVFVLGLALAVIGGMAVYSGAPIIQIERGWAEVIAGSVAVSGGVVTIALAVVVAQIKDLRRAVRQGSARPIQPAAEPEPSLAELRPTRGPEEAVFVSGSGEVQADERSPEFQHPAESHETRGIASAGAGDADQPEAAAAIVSEGRAPEPAIAAAEGEGHAPPVDHAEARAASVESSETLPRRLIAPSSDLTQGADREQGRTAAPLSRDWLTRPLLRSRSPRTVPDASLPVPETPEAEDQTPALPAAHHERPEIAESEPLSADAATLVTPAPGFGEDHAPPPEATVIGRYQSGASSYTMYSDGAIDVETEGGEVHRFGSMEDLKTFIARQERALEA